jgi:hypothetical protein
MKSDIFTRTTLVIIALALALIAGQGALKHPMTVDAASQQRWLYKTIHVRFQWENNTVTRISYISNDGNQLNGPPAMQDVMNALGNDGWELVSATPYSMWISNGTVAGMTTDEILIFRHEAPL